MRVFVLIDAKYPLFHVRKVLRKHRPYSLVFGTVKNRWSIVFVYFLVSGLVQVATQIISQRKSFS